MRMTAARRAQRRSASRSPTAVNPPVTGQNFAIVINAVNVLPVNSVPDTQGLAANASLAIAGVAVNDADAGSGAMSRPCRSCTAPSRSRQWAAPAWPAAARGGTVTGTLAEINATLAGEQRGLHAGDRYFGTDTLTMVTNDNGNTGMGGPLSDTDTVAINLHTHLIGTPDDDEFTRPRQYAHRRARRHSDTITFGFRLVDATRSLGRQQGHHRRPFEPHGAERLREVFVFTDGTVDNNDGDPLVDDLFYYSQNHDVWNAHVDADVHYHRPAGTRAATRTRSSPPSIYLSANPDVKAAGVNPLDPLRPAGWQEGRVPSIAFDPRSISPPIPTWRPRISIRCAHFLQIGASEGRQPIAPSELIAANGFDYVYYLQHNPDVAAAGVDPFVALPDHRLEGGAQSERAVRHERLPRGLHRRAAAHINPLDHYNVFGWHEGRDPSVGFDTTSYLAAKPDVAAARHRSAGAFPAVRHHEGRSPFADGVWG